MNLRLILIISLLCFFTGNIYSQESGIMHNDNYKKLDLSEKIINSGESAQDNDIRLADINATKKSPGISILLSLLLPGAGHFYIDRMDVGQYFLAGDGAAWLGLAGVNIYGNILRDNAETFAVDHAGVDQQGKDEQYYTNIGNFISIYEYNNEKLSFGEFDKIYTDIDKFYWNWDTQENQFRYEAQKGESERVKNTTIIFASALIVNRIASAISAIVLTNQHNNALSNIKFDTQLTTNPQNRIDGFRLNLIKQF